MRDDGHLISSYVTYRRGHTSRPYHRTSKAFPLDGTRPRDTQPHYRRRHQPDETTGAYCGAVNLPDVLILARTLMGGGRRRRLGSWADCARCWPQMGSCTTSTQCLPSPCSCTTRLRCARVDPARDRSRPRGAPASDTMPPGPPRRPAWEYGRRPRELRHHGYGRIACWRWAGARRGHARSIGCRPGSPVSCSPLRRSIQHGAPAVLEPDGDPVPHEEISELLQLPAAALSEAGRTIRPQGCFVTM